MSQRIDKCVLRISFDYYIRNSSKYVCLFMRLAQNSLHAVTRSRRIVAWLGLFSNTAIFYRCEKGTSLLCVLFWVDMECLREWSHSVERILILGCGLHEPFTMGRSDGCVVQNSTIVWYSFLSLVLVANRLELLIFSWLVPGWIVVLNYFMIMLR